MDQDTLEEGEISSDSGTDYTPLPRPENYLSSAVSSKPRFPPIIQDTDSEPEQQSSDDSDSDSPAPKVKKVKIKLKPIAKLSNRPKKYDIWSTRVQEDVLSETLNSCDVTTKDRSRNVESYDYTLAYKYHKQDYDNLNKRSRENSRDRKRKVGKCRQSTEEKKGSSRNILNLNVTLESEVQDIAKDIANKLYEEKEDLILKILETVGKEKCFELFNKTQEIEADGGMLILNQSRRRTPGGVFLYMTRMDEFITKEQRDAIFGEADKKNKDQRKLQRKKKNLKLKLEIAQARANLLIKHEEKYSQNLNKHLANPPPSPATEDCVNSRDSTDVGLKSSSNLHENLLTYDEDFLDITGSNEMEMF